MQVRSIDSSRLAGSDFSEVVIMKVGFIGLGHMGSGMAASLLQAGHEVTVYNRTPEKAEPLREKGAKVAQSISDACKGDAVITMLADDHAVEDVVFGEGGILESLSRGGIHISSSTISVALAERLAAAHADSGQGFVAAPVFGRPDVAATGQLAVVAAGSRDTLDTVMPLLAGIGRRTFALSDKPGAALLVKLSGNFLIASFIESFGEAIALIDKGGVDRNAYLDLVTFTHFDAPLYKGYGRLVTERKFEPAGFAVPLAEKDIRLALTASEDLRVPMPVAGLLRDRYLRLLANGGEKLDWSAIGDLPAMDAGVHVDSTARSQPVRQG